MPVSTEANPLSLHGDSWQEWVLTNLEKNCSPADMFKKMVAGVWDRESAAAALNEGLQQLGIEKTWQTPLPSISLHPDLLNGAGQPVRILCRTENPHTVLLDQVLSDGECQQLIDYAHGKGLKRSGVVNERSGDSVQHDARTSSSVFFTRAETPLISRIEKRLSQLTNWPLENGEGLQLLQYEPGQEYKPHFDWFNPENRGAESHLKRGGQRVGTLVLYLQTPESGGGTRFPKSGIEVMPNRGGAIFFTDMEITGEPDQNTLHAGTPVVSGTKMVLTYWQRQGAFNSGKA